MTLAITADEYRGAHSACGGKAERIAQRLGVSTSTARRKCLELGLPMVQCGDAELAEIVAALRDGPRLYCGSVAQRRAIETGAARLVRRRGTAFLEAACR